MARGPLDPSTLRKFLHDLVEKYKSQFFPGKLRGNPVDELARNTDIL
jgi:hypothetical protein